LYCEIATADRDAGAAARPSRVRREGPEGLPRPTFCRRTRPGRPVGGVLAELGAEVVGLVVNRGTVEGPSSSTSIPPTFSGSARDPEPAPGVLIFASDCPTNRGRPAPARAGTNPTPCRPGCTTGPNVRAPEEQVSRSNSRSSTGGPRRWTASEAPTSETVSFGRRRRRFGEPRCSWDAQTPPGRTHPRRGVVNAMAVNPAVAPARITFGRPGG